MVDFVAGLKRPFQDIKTLVIGIILGMIPFVSALTLPGFGLRAAERTLKGDNKLPDWFENIGEVIIKSVMSIVISLIYMLPALIVLVAVIVMFAANLLGTLTAAISGGTFDYTALMAALGPMLMYFAVVIVLLLIAVFLLPSALMHYLIRSKFSAAFSFGSVIKKALTMKYIVACIFSIILYILLMIVVGILSLIPVAGTLIGSGLMMYVIPVAEYTWFAEACK